MGNDGFHFCLVVYIPMSPQPIETIYASMATDDYRWAGPTSTCMCGNNLFLMVGSFHERELSFYYTTAMCLGCNSLLTLPTEVDDYDPIQSVHLEDS